MGKRRRSALLLAAALVLVVPACSSSSKASKGDTGDSGATSTPTTLTRPVGPKADLSELTGGKGMFLASASLLDPNAPKDPGYTEAEYAAGGKAVSYKANGDLPADGTYDLATDGSADYKTRIVVRRPAADHFNGTVLVEWLNVSGGLDAAPDYTYLHDEIVRKGYAWVGVSAQRIGIDGGAVAVGIPAADSVGAGKGLVKIDPARYGSLHHPGDAYSYDIYTQVARAIRAPGSVDALGGLKPKHLIAVGESQSAFTLTTYADGVQPLTHAFDGFFIHSRGGAAAPLGKPGAGIDIAGSITGKPTRIRTDLKVPVMMLQTESDVAGILGYLPARQPDTDLIRLWEMAGTAHVDTYQLGAIADSFGCTTAINSGPQHFVLSAALRALNTWITEGTAPPEAERLDVGEDGKYVTDENGNATGGIRTPPVDVPVDVLSGLPGEGGGVACVLAGRTVPIPADRLAALYPSRQAYLDDYAKATDAAVEAGFVLPEDRQAMLDAAQPDRIAG